MPPVQVGRARATRQIGSLRRVPTGNASNRKVEVGWRIAGADVGAPQRLSTPLRTKKPFWFRSPTPSDSAGRVSNGRNGSTTGDSEVLVPSASVALLRNRSV